MDGRAPEWMNRPIRGELLARRFARRAPRPRGHRCVPVANSGVIDVRCPDSSRPTEPPAGSITLITQDGKPTRFSGGGLTIPWGIAVDGNANVWVANFAGRRLSQLCGRKTSSCPRGAHPGDAISPNDTGYGSDGLVGNTAVAIDPSGNVWVTSNWKIIARQTNPGGYEMVVFVGLGGLDPGLGARLSSRRPVAGGSPWDASTGRSP